jgi:hypothetical protein
MQADSKRIRMRQQMVGIRGAQREEVHNFQPAITILHREQGSA